MNPFDPYRHISLEGDGLTRGVTLALPSDQVRSLLPNGLELGPQQVTNAGMHPVVFLFHEMFRAHMTVPTLLPNMSYREHSIGIPFSHVARDWVDGMSPGPYYFMPTVLLDDPLAVLGGILYWGFAKHMAELRVRDGRYTVASSHGDPLAEFHSGAQGDEIDADAGDFKKTREMLDQPIISMLPMALGPFFVCSRFDKRWECATLHRLTGSLEISEAYVPGLPVENYSAADLARDVQPDVLVSYEYRAPWRLSLPYPVIPRY